MAQSLTLITYYTIAKLFEDNNKLLMRGENALRSGHLESCMYDSTNGVINGKVLASMRDKIYKVEITLNEDFDVSRSWCQCPRGEAVCHHIATVLLYAKENFSKTDAPCSWVRKKIPKEVKTAAKLYPSSKQSVLNREPDNSDRDWFRQALDVTDRISGNYNN